MNQATEALEYYNRVIKIQEQATLNANIDTNLATSLKEVYQCLLQLNQKKEALVCYDRAMKIKRAYDTECHQ